MSGLGQPHLESGGHASSAGSSQGAAGELHLELLKEAMVQVSALSSLTDSGRLPDVEACYLDLLRQMVLHCHSLRAMKTSLPVASWKGSVGSPGTSFFLNCFPKEYLQALAFFVYQVRVERKQILAN